MTVSQGGGQNSGFVTGSGTGDGGRTEKVGRDAGRRWVMGCAVLIHTLFALCMLVFFLYSAVWTVYFDVYADTDNPVAGREHLFPLILMLTAALSILYFLRFSSFGRKLLLAEGRRKLLRVLLLYTSCVSLYLILALKGTPNSDASAVETAVLQFLQGDFSELTKRGTYFDLCPHQLGYAAAEQLLSVIFGTQNHMVYELCNLVSILLSLWVLVLIAEEIFEDEFAAGITVVLAFGLICLHLYSTYFYGDIWAMAPEFAALYLLILYLKRHRYRFLLSSSACIGMACLLKTNCLIALLAIAVVLLIGAAEWMMTAQWKNALAAVLAVLLLFGVKTGMKEMLYSGYARAAGVSAISRGIPASGYIAMGLQEQDGIRDGWFNHYNWSVYQENDFDYEAADREARENIRATLSAWKERPRHGARVLLEKSVSMWADPSCASIHQFEYTGRHSGGHPALIVSIISGRWRGILTSVMNLWQSLLYFGAAFYGFASLKKREAQAVCQLLPEVFILGGICFLTLWEANSRSVLHYYIMLLPLAAAGICRFLEVVHGIIKRIFPGRRSDGCLLFLTAGFPRRRK